MLAGRGVTAIWNDVAPGAEDDFLAWHMREHMAERVDLPGFRRARRHVAWDAATRPAFFTLYEADSLAVLTGQEYINRLNGMTPWTRRVMATLRGTARGLARVAESAGAGLGGLMLTLRFAAPAAAEAPIAALLRDLAGQPRIAGAHLCLTDPAASGTAPAEAALRPEEAGPPDWFILVEGTDPATLGAILPDEALRALGVAGPVRRGLYRLEYMQEKAPPGP